MGIYLVVILHFFVILVSIEGVKISSLSNQLLFWEKSVIFFGVLQVEFL
jgi:hypothetical protein